MKLSNCCGMAFEPPGWPDSDLCSRCKEHSMPCEHKNKTYQAEEWDTNVPESYTCDECGKDFDIPEPSFEDEVMEDEYNECLDCKKLFEDE